MVSTHCEGYLSVLNKSNDPVVTQALVAGANGSYWEALGILNNSDTIDARFLRGLTNYKLGNKDLALKEFQQLVGVRGANFLVPAFHDAIIGKSAAAAEMYGGHEFTKFFKTASQSILFRDMHLVANNTIAAHPPASDTFTVVDLGIGTGALVESIVRWIPKKWPHVRRVNIIGVEPSAELAKTAEDRINRVKSDTSLAVDLKIIASRAQDLDATFAHSLPHFDVVNATASIHHMPKSEKKTLLKTIHSWAPDLFVITDADSDHDSDIPDLSYALVANVTSFYDAVLNYMVSADPKIDNRHDYEGFCFYDARNIVLETGSRRIEYHTTAKKWVGYLLEAGFDVLTPQLSWLAGVDPQNSSIEDGYLLTAKYVRPISFQITAKPKGDNQ